MSSYKALNLDENEHVVLEVRKHWIVFVGYAAALLFAAIVPIIFYFTLISFYPSVATLHLSNNDPMLFLFLYILWLLFLWISFFLNWTKYYLDVWYVTEERIIAVEQRSIFNRSISNLRFDRIQDVTVDVRGFISTLLDFGNVKVQTAGEDNFDFFMPTVRRPGEVRRVIFNTHNKISDVSKNIPI